MRKIERALISVSDKSNLETIAKKLHENNVEIISSGGTGKFLETHNIPFTPIEKVTGNPESFGGRMKTLSFQVSSALLFRRDHINDEQQAKELSIQPIDLVICNLYPFEEVAKRDHSWDELIENIDIGGPTMIRAAAKNYKDVGVVTSPDQYEMIIEDITKEKGALKLETCQKLSLEAFRHTARYDALIAAKMEEHWEADTKTITLSPKGASTLRYGENPHQKSWVYQDPFQKGLANTVPLQGKELSYNNLLDADAAWRSCGDVSALKLKDFPFAVSIIKHLSPCGLALGKTAIEALELAWAGDQISAFGGILSFNQEVKEDIATWLSDRFIEVILAPSYSEDALKIFAKKKNLRVIQIPTYDGIYKSPIVRSISGGWLVQQEDTGVDSEFKPVTNIPFPKDKNNLARFGVMACKHLKSNAIGLFKTSDTGLSMIGAGMGNPNRLISMQQAFEKAEENGHTDLSDVVLVSDAFFPFSDSIEIAEKAKIKYIVQPGGSIKDKDVIHACEEADISMTFTGRRHFRH